MAIRETARRGVERSSRRSKAGAGWACQREGSFESLVPAKAPRFSWVRPSVLWGSRNDLLAKWFGDPSGQVRRRWVAAQRARGVDTDFLIDSKTLESYSFLLLGDSGEGDRSQYAVVPVLLKLGADTDFMIICSDVVYPTGRTVDYADKFFRPYQAYPAPIYAVPGNHDWYDDLGGFMRIFCDAPLLPREHARPRTWAWLRDLLWRPPQPVDEETLARMRALRGMPSQQRVQPGPYWVMETGPLRIVGIDIGITGGVDAEQGAWLRRVSAGPKPKLLVTGKPVYVDNRYDPCPIEGGGAVDELVRDPVNNYVAVVGGDVHNYQRYPVRVGDRILQYVVCGGGGAFMHATHTIPKVSVGGVAERDFRCYPLRGDSLSFYSQLYDRRLHTRGLLHISPDQATKIMCDRLGIECPPRAPDTNVAVTWRTWLVARMLGVGPVRQVRLPVGRFFHRYFSEYSDWDDPPFFKSFLHAQVEPGTLTLRCFAATGCREHELDPPMEDEVTISLTR